jgi:hypothetical protein
MVDLVQIIATAAALTVVVGGMAAALVAIRRWIAGVAATTDATKRQLTVSNGHTVGNYVEKLAAELPEVRQEIADVKAEIGTLTSWSSQNRDIATAAAALAKHASDRLDEHLRGHDGERS